MLSAFWTHYINTIREFDPACDLSHWHRWALFLPRRGINGSLVFNQVWRRKTATGWEYRPREMGEEQWWNEQW